MTRARLLTAAVSLSLALSLALVPAASASPNDGTGLWGPTDDKVITYTGLILVVFFPLFIFVASMILKALEKRKDARKAAAKAAKSSAHLSGGW